MAELTAQYPGAIWDGLSSNRGNRGIHRGAEAEDFDRIAAELIATQTQLDAVNAKILTKRVTVTTAQQLTSKTVPTILIAAPGAGIAIIVEQIVAKQTFLAAAYAYTTVANISYTDESGAVIQDYTALFLETVATAISAHAPNVLTGAAAGTRVVENAPVVWGAPDADPTTGDGPLVIDIRYRLLTM